MKTLILILSLFISTSEPKTFGIDNASGQDMQLRVWQAGKLKYDIILHSGDKLTFNCDVRTLIQWKFKCDRTDLYDMGEEILPNGWVQWYILINFDYLGFWFDDRKCKDVPRA